MLPLPSLISTAPFNGNRVISDKFGGFSSPSLASRRRRFRVSSSSSGLAPRPHGEGSYHLVLHSRADGPPRVSQEVGKEIDRWTCLHSLSRKNKTRIRKCTHAPIPDMIGFWYDTERPARARVRSSKHETATLTLSLTRYDDHAPTSMTSHLSLSLSLFR